MDEPRSISDFPDWLQYKIKDLEEKTTTGCLPGIYLDVWEDARGITKTVCPKNLDLFAHRPDAYFGEPCRPVIDSLRKLQNRLAGLPSATADNPSNSIILVGGMWQIHFEGDPPGQWSQKGNKAIAWLQQLLTKPNRTLTVADLTGDPDGRLRADASAKEIDSTSNPQMATLRASLEEIEDIAEETTWTEDLENRRQQLQAQLDTLDEGSRAKSNHRRQHGNITRQLRRLGLRLSRMPRLAAHLKACLDLSYPDFRYSPPASFPAWKI